MSEWDTIGYAFVCGAMLMMAGIGLESAAVSPGLDRWEKRLFIAFFALVALRPASYFLEMAGFLLPDLFVLVPVAYFLDYLAFVSVFPLLAVYLLHCCGHGWRGSQLLWAMCALWSACLALVIVAQLTDLVYSVGSDGELVHGPAYLALVVPAIAMLLLLDTCALRWRAELSAPYRRAFLVCLVPLTLVACVHVLTYAYPALLICLVVSTYAMYRVIEAGAIEKDLRQRREIASQRTSIAVLQMRPHFIYNTMGVIYHLCDQDPDLAKRVTRDFTTYLRKNFTAIASEDDIPFAEELEHARAYLAVESAQYEDDLVVTYDTPHTLFRIPPLTLQPLVENAVKHGMDLDHAPLHVWVRTRKTSFGSEVIVEDDGCGFVAIGDGEPHIALDNIAQRLSMSCGGQLLISERAGGGSVVRLRLPDRG